MVALTVALKVELTEQILDLVQRGGFGDGLAVYSVGKETSELTRKLYN